MRTISLWQPYASLVIAGTKRFETRGRRPPQALEGVRIAIHAARKPIPAGCYSAALHALCGRLFGEDYASTLPYGAVVGTVRLSGSKPVEEIAAGLGRDEEICGDWSPGRFAWSLESPEGLPSPVPAVGRQGWWNWVPDQCRASRDRIGEQADGRHPSSQASLGAGAPT